MMVQRQELPPWLFMIFGMLGFLLARGGLSLDFLYTAADALRTLAMLGVIVFGCIMVFQDIYTERAKYIAAPPKPSLVPIDSRTVTISAQQFKTLLSLASAAQLTNGSAAVVEPAPVPEPPVVVPSEVSVVVATVPEAAAENTAENSENVDTKPN